MNLVGVWQSPHTHRFLKIQSGVLGGVLMSPNAMANESHCGDTNEQPCLRPLHHVIQIQYLVHILTPPLDRTIILVPHEYHLSEDVLGHLL